MRIVEPYAVMLGADSMAPQRQFEVTLKSEDGKWYSAFTPIEGKRMLQRIEYYARVSHASEDAITPDSYNRFLRSVVLQHGDLSVIEHEKVTCEFLVDRGITHEIVRHRIGSYTQESTRFVNYQKKGGEAKFIFPLNPNNNLGNSDTWNAAMLNSEMHYMSLLNAGIKPQIARSVLPNALASKIVVTYNLRSWRHFFIMRTSLEAHPQMRQVCDPLLREFQTNIPILFEDLEPGMRQAEAMRKLR